MDNPSSNRWMAMILPPFCFEPLEVRLPDESVRRAVWTGAKWWSDGQEIIPQAWRPVEPELPLGTAPA